MTFAAEPITSRGVPDLSFLLTHASHVLATRMTAAFAEIGITPREYCVLAHAMGGSHTQIELSKLADGSRVIVRMPQPHEQGERAARPHRVRRDRARQAAGGLRHGADGARLPRGGRTVITQRFQR